MYLKFYNASGRQVGYGSTNPRDAAKDRARGIKYHKNVTRIVTLLNGKPIQTHIIITRKVQETR